MSGPVRRALDAAEHRRAQTNTVLLKVVILVIAAGAVFVEWPANPWMQWSILEQLELGIIAMIALVTIIGMHIVARLEALHERLYPPPPDLPDAPRHTVGLADIGPPSRR